MNINGTQIYKPLQTEDINSFLVVSFLFIPVVTVLINNLLNSGIAVWIFASLILGLSVFINRNNFSKTFIFIIALIVLFFLSDYILSISSSDVLDSFIEFLKFGFPIIYLTSNRLSYRSIVKSWHFYSLLSIPILFIDYFFLSGSSNLNYMDFGVHLSIICVGLALIYLDKREKKHIFLFITLLIIIFIYGNRGSLLSVLSILLYILYAIYKVKFLKVFSVICIFAIVLYTTGFLHYVYSGLLELLIDMGANPDLTYSLKKIEMFLEYGFMTASSGRDQIYRETINIIVNNKGLPLGTGYYKHVTTYVYPHNILLELFVVFGFMAMPIIIYIVYRALFFLKNKESQHKIHIFIVITILAFTRLMFSGSFIYDSMFWFSISILLFKSDGIFKARFISSN